MAPEQSEKIVGQSSEVVMTLPASGECANYRATLEYDGTDYGGFQIQVNRPTIQGQVEQVLQRLTGAAVRVHGAGRTDAGVHARGQVISFKAMWKHSCEDLERALNALLPPAIAVRDVAVAEERFHARYSAASRQYVYTIYSARVRSPLLDRWMWHVDGRPDLWAMSEAARSLRGEHDFAAFGQAPGGENTVRKVHRAEWRRVTPVAGLWPGCEEVQCLEFEIEANGFLRGMVRRVVGTMIAVGMGWLSTAGFADILVSRDIRRAWAPAPACGLCLMGVQYGPEARARG